MPIKQPETIHLSEKQRKILKKLDRGTHVPLHFKTRSHIILMAADGVNNTQISKQEKLDRNRVKKWRNRWADSQEMIHQKEREKPHALKATIKSVLSDEQRPGRSRFFTDEQVAQMITMACQSPEDYDLPFSHWTPGKLARQAEGIVDTISTRSVGRFLKISGCKTTSEQGLAQPKNR